MLPRLAPATSLPARTSDTCRGRGGWSRTPERVAQLMQHRRPIPVAPAGYQYADSPVVWLRQVESNERVQAMRADRRRTLLCAARILARTWHPVTRISSPGHSQMAEELQCDKRTIGRAVKVLMDFACILRTGEGRTLGPGGAERVLRAEYALLVPAGFPIGAETPRSAPARWWPSTSVPRTRRDRLTAAASLSRQLRVVSPSGRISTPAVAAVLRPFFAAGWHLADVLHALDHRPTDGAWTFETSVRDVAGWVRHRLSWWMGATGSPRLSRSQRERDAAAQARARAQARAAAEQADRAAAVPAMESVTYQAQRAALRDAHRRDGCSVVSQNVAPSPHYREGVKQTPPADAREASPEVPAREGGPGFNEYRQTRQRLASQRAASASVAHDARVLPARAGDRRLRRGLVIQGHAEDTGVGHRQPGRPTSSPSPARSEPVGAGNTLHTPSSGLSDPDHSQHHNQS